MSAKAVDDRTGRITNARVFNARVPVAAIDAGNAARALDRGLSIVLLSIVRWVGTGPRVRLQSGARRPASERRWFP